MEKRRHKNQSQWQSRSQEELNAISYCSSTQQLFSQLPLQGHCRRWESWGSVATWCLEFGALCSLFSFCLPLSPSFSIYLFSLLLHPPFFLRRGHFYCLLVACTQDSWGEDLTPLAGHYPYWSISLGRLLTPAFLISLGHC